MPDRFTSIPTNATDLGTLIDQILAAGGAYATAFESALLTEKQSVMESADTAVTAAQATNDTENAAYIAARDAYYAARDVLALAKSELADRITSARTHIERCLAAETQDYTAQDFADLETATGIALTLPYAFDVPHDPVFSSGKLIGGTTVFLNWQPSLADSDGHCAASAYLIEASANGTDYTYAAVMTSTEAYLTKGSNTHYRVAAIGEGGQSNWMVKAVADLPTA